MILTKKTYCPYVLLTRVHGDLHCTMYIQYTYFYVALHAGSPGLYLYNLVITPNKNSTFTREDGGGDIFLLGWHNIYPWLHIQLYFELYPPVYCTPACRGWETKVESSTVLETNKTMIYIIIKITKSSSGDAENLQTNIYI